MENLFKSIKKIIVPIDFSETSNNALEHGAFLAKLIKAELLLVHVLEKHFQKFLIVAPSVQFEMPSNIFGIIQDRLNEIAENVRMNYGVNALTLCTEGVISDEIVSIATSEKADLIIMGTHGTSGLSEVFLGSNAFKVVTLSDIPVLTVQSHTTRIGFSSILLPVDNSTHSRQKITPVINLAKSYSSSIHLLGLLTEDEKSNLEKFTLKIDQTKQYIHKSGVPVVAQVEVANNLAKHTIGKAVEMNADLIVIMTDQEDDFTGSFLGPYAQQIVNHSKVPVLSIKPKENANQLDWTYPYN